jgi:hypothetical protein
MRSVCSSVVAIDPSVAGRSLPKFFAASPVSEQSGYFELVVGVVRVGAFTAALPHQSRSVVKRSDRRLFQRQPKSLVLR